MAILDRYEPAFHCVPARADEARMERLDDTELTAIADVRKGQAVIEVTPDER